MAFNYFIKKNAGDSHQATFYWLAAIVRFANGDTYNHSFQSAHSYNGINSIEELDTLLVTDDIVSWSTVSEKGNNINSFTMTLIRSSINYLTNVDPGDWVIFWCFNNKRDYDTTVTKVKNKQRANFFTNSPKFIGRVNSIVRDETKDPASGTISVFYTMACVGFSEFDATMYYNPTLTINLDKRFQPLKILSDFSPESIKILTSSNQQLNGIISGGVISSQEAIPFFLSTCLGTGPGQNFRNPIENEAQYTSLATQTSPNSTFKIPTTVANLLLPINAPKIKKESFTYADLINVAISIQKYNASSANETNPTLSDVFKGFQPASNSDQIIGVMPISSTDFNNTSVWSILTKYSNVECLNEMFVTLRVNTDGFVMPTLVCRQMPFSTPNLLSKIVNIDDSGSSSNDTLQSSSSNHPLSNTQYTSLPRWVLDDSMVYKIQTGKSDVFRQNYLQMQLPDVFGGPVQQSLDFQLSLPVIDDVDIDRSGLRMHVSQIKSIYNSSALKAGGETPGHQFNILKADMLFGGHLKLSGTINCEFIQEPICVGDNCVAEDVLYHIERVTHSGSIDFGGNKEANTVLAVTNGISAESKKRQIYVDNKYTKSFEQERFTVDFDFGKK